MWLKHYFKVSLILLLVATVISCTGGGRTKKKVSNAEKAALNVQMGVRYMEMGMYKTAKEKLETAEKLDPKNAETQNALAVLYERLKQLQTAEKKYKKAVDLDSDDASISNNYGRFLCERGRYSEGKELLQRSASMPFNSRKWIALTNYGICELKQGNDNNAEKSFRLALKESGKYPPALLEMQKLSYQQGNYMSARAFLIRYLENSSHSSETLWYGLNTERALGNQQQAEIYLRKLLRDFPDSEEASRVN